MPDPGRQEIDGDKLYAIILNSAGQTSLAEAGSASPVHRIQVNGRGRGHDRWKGANTCKQMTRPTMSRRRVLFTDAPDTWFDVVRGTFAIFFPEDATRHLPAKARSGRSSAKY